MTHSGDVSHRNVNPVVNNERDGNERRDTSRESARLQGFRAAVKSELQKLKTRYLKTVLQNLIPDIFDGIFSIVKEWFIFYNMTEGSL